EVTSVSPRRWRRGELPTGLPDVVLFDLRQEGALEQAAEWSAHVRGPGLVTGPWIGVTDAGIPLDAVVQADQLFTGFSSVAFETARLERTLRLARKRMLARGCGKPEECRSLGGTTRTFRTYEPSLFSMLENLQLAAEHDFTILLTAETG